MAKETKLEIEGAKAVKLPHIFVLLFGMIAISAILSLVLPPGQFERAPNAQGRTVVVPGTYHAVERSGVGPFKAFSMIFDGLVNAADIVFFIFIAFASISMLLHSGAIHGLVSGLVKVLKGKARLAVIPIFLAVFGLAASTIGMFEEAMPFVPVFVGIAIALGYDALIGLSIVAVGVGIGYSGAAMNPFTVGVAQGIAELPPLSGAGYRIICHIVMLTVTSVYMIIYAGKIQKDPTKSLVYVDDFSNFDMSEESLKKTQIRHTPNIGAYRIFHNAGDFRLGRESARLVFRRDCDNVFDYVNSHRHHDGLEHKRVHGQTHRRLTRNHHRLSDGRHRARNKTHT